VPLRSWLFDKFPATRCRRRNGHRATMGQVSIQTTERCLGCKQRIRSAVNDQIGIEPSR
jgi:hypothetical protein